MKKTIIQGVSGCFHEEAARKYFGTKELEVVPARTFDLLGKCLAENPTDHLAIMAIENSIAGTILQNYRILRENQFRVIGEVYLRIVHNLLAIPGQTVEDIVEVSSHPMAIHQCHDFFRKYPEIKLTESDDTALSAREVRDNGRMGYGAIASKAAGDIYGLENIVAGIETSKTNYTRFFIVQPRSEELSEDAYELADKASIYLRTGHEQGALLKVLKVIDGHNINLSKLQSFPILGELNKYYFHLDLEFEKWKDYESAIRDLQEVTDLLEILGVYKRATIA